MTVVVTGAEGQLGSELCRQYGLAAIGLDFPTLDLTCRDTLLRTLVPLRPSVVINTAAFTQVDAAEQNRDLCYAVNAHGVSHLVEACQETGSTLVQISTDYVFGGDEARREPYRETDLPAPINVYGESKLQSERLAASWNDHLIIRTCGLYGALGRRSGGNIVHTLLQLGRTRDSLRIVDDQECTPSYVPHVAAAIRSLVAKQATGLYHVVNTGSTTWYAFAAELFRLAAIDVRLEPISSEEYGAPARRPRFSVLETDTYHAVEHVPRMCSFQCALREFLASSST